MGVVGAVVVPHPPLIMPEIGRGEEKKIQPTIDAYREAMRRMAALKPDTVIISSPHATMYADYFHISPRDHAAGDFGDFRVPGLKLEADYDAELVKTLSRCLMEAGVDGGTGAERMPKLDHGTMVPLRFVQEVMPDVKIVRVAAHPLPFRRMRGAGGGDFEPARGLCGLRRSLPQAESRRPLWFCRRRPGFRQGVHGCAGGGGFSAALVD